MENVSTTFVVMKGVIFCVDTRLVFSLFELISSLCILT
jgi:hypothetical protein